MKTAELAAKLLDSIEQPPGISIEDREEIERRAKEAHGGAAGIPWAELKRELLTRSGSDLRLRARCALDRSA